MYLEETMHWKVEEKSFFFFLPFLGPCPWNMEVPRTGIKSEV